MARARWLTVRSEKTARRLAALALAVAASAVGADAHADIELVPAADGQLGAWLVAGPLSAAHVNKLDLERIQPTSGKDRQSGLRFALVSARDGAMDLDQALGTRKKPGAIALLGGEIELAKALSGWLLLSIDGKVRVTVDGKQVWKRDTSHLRARSWDAVPLQLAPGRHRVVLQLEHPGQWWAAELRLLDREDLMPPRDARLVLPGTDAADGARLATEMLTSRLELRAQPTGHSPTLKLSYRRGAPATAPLPVAITWSAHRKQRHQLEAGSIPVGPRGVQPFEVALPPLAEAEPTGRYQVDATVGSTRVRVGAQLDAKTPALLARAANAKQRLRDGSLRVSDVETVDATIDYFVSELEQASPSSKSELESWLSELEAKRDPLARTGTFAFARRSAVDAEPDPVVVHVPKSYGPGTTRRYPLVVALHGLNGTPRRIVEVFLDQKSNAPVVDGFVLAPFAHGNAFYRGPGELEVLSAIDWMLATYPIDRTQVSITGVSMGGTGAAHLALRYTDRFAAAAPLCGYHSYFVRRDTSNRPIRPWERDRMHHWSPASWAERGRSLPMWVAHGTKDWPLDNSKVLVARYKQLGYAMTDEWPDTGHDVWTKAYAGARLWPWLTRARLDVDPQRVTIKTDALRFAQRAWASITRLSQPGHMGLLDATAESSHRVVVQTQGVDAFELGRRAPRLDPTAAVELEIDGQKLAFDAGEPLFALRKDAKWVKGRAPAGGKRAGLEGPIRDAFLGAVVFSYGTGDPRTARANREVALTLARTRNGPDVRYRVLSDRELDELTESSNAVVAVGTPRDHRLLASVGGSLPIRVDGAALVAGSTRYERSGTGAISIQPNPRHPERYLVVVTGLDAAGIWRALSLPQLLPDFLVYDEGVAAAANEVVLGRDARVLAGGFFDASWRLPTQTNDSDAGP